MSVCPAKTQISLGIRPVWSESSLSAWRNLRSLATHWVHNEDSDQTGRMPRLIWVLAGRTLILLVLSCCGSNRFRVILIVSLFTSFISMHFQRQLWYFILIFLKIKLSHVMRKPYANNKGADHPAHPCSLISTYVVRCLDSIIPTLAKSKISRL